VGTLRSFLLPPAPGAGPHDTLRWVRRQELLVGGLSLVITVALWNEISFHWLLVGCALLSLSPWPGAAAILRRAETKPQVPITDPERRRSSGRRGAVILVAFNAVTGAVVGYVVNGWPVAATLAVVTALIATVTSWWSLRRLGRSRSIGK
jgi:cobalamin synthase